MTNQHETPSFFRRALRRLMMLDPGYRKASFLEQKIDRLYPELLSVIAAAKPADRTDELKAAIAAAAKSGDRTAELDYSQDRRQKELLDRLNALEKTDEAKSDHRQRELLAVAEAEKTGQDRRQKELLDRLNALEKTNEAKSDYRQRELIGEISAFRQAQQDIFEILPNALRDSERNVLRDNIRCRWQTIDALDGLLYPPSTIVQCVVCGHREEKRNLQTRVAECIFGGGRLERFLCPECGCIFGPLKMMALSQEQLAEEYKQSYSVYRETDCTFLEKPTFMALNPTKSGVYLNYGAGAWNHTTIDLRNEGYQIFDYEPYAPADDRAWVIRDEESLKKMKFDGIFSNDLLEHFQHPVDGMRFMKSLLNPDGKMAHTTGCYDYEYPYTRFHYVFFTGKSLDVLSKKIGCDYDLRGRINDRYPSRLCLFTLKDCLADKGKDL